MAIFTILPSRKDNKSLDVIFINNFIIPLHSLYTQWKNYVNLVILVMLTGWPRLLLSDHIIDDAYITFRYAENLSSGLGFVFNPGEKILGTTTPLYTILLALIHICTGFYIPQIGRIISVISSCITVIVIYELSQILFPRSQAGIVAGLLFAISPFQLRSALGGMETPFFIMLIISTLYYWINNRIWVGIGLCALATLTRPEGLLLMGIYSVSLLFSRRWKRLGFVYLEYFVILLPWIIFSISYFGNILPQSMLAKTSPVFLWSFQETVTSFITNFAFIFFGNPLARSAGGVWWTGWTPVISSFQLGLIVGILFVGQGVIFLKALIIGYKSKAQAWPILAFPFVYIIFYLLGGLKHVMIFDWYFPPLEIFYLLFLTGGLINQWKSPKSYMTNLFIILGLLACEFSGLELNGKSPFSPIGMDTDRENSYIEVANRFSSKFQPDVVVAAPEIGALGFSSHVKILDTVGLISTGESSYYPIPQGMYVDGNRYAIPPKLILDQKPEFVVSLDIFMKNSLLKSSEFLNLYQSVYQQDVLAFGGLQKLYVFQLK